MGEDLSNKLAITKILVILQHLCIVSIVVDHVGVNPTLVYRSYRILAIGTVLDVFSNLECELWFDYQ